MMKIKRVLKITGLLLAGLLLALLVAPFVFKDRILEEIKKFANESVNAKIDFRDVDVSFIRSFSRKYLFPYWIFRSWVLILSMSKTC